jgi:hypothetical protein
MRMLPTRMQQLGLLILLVVFVVYVLLRVGV